MMDRKSNVSRNAAAAAKKDYLSTKRAILKTLCLSIHETAKRNNGRLPYGYMKEYSEAQQKSYAWITYHTLNCYYQHFKKSQGDGDPQSVTQQPCQAICTSPLQSSVSDLSGSLPESAQNAGRPSGTTMIDKKQKKDDIIKMKNDITAEYIKMKEEQEGKLKKGQLESIIIKHKGKRKLDDIHIPKNTIIQRIV